MSESYIDSVLKRHIHKVAPEADLDQLQPDEELGEALDIDSMDFYNIMVAISGELQIDIPEEKYGQLRTLRGIKAFLSESVSSQ